MSLFKQVHEAMAGVGAGTAIPVVDEYKTEQTWHIAMDSETEIFGEIDEERRVLVLSTELGAPPKIERASLELALAFGHIWSENGGVHLTMEGPDGPFWLIMDVSANDLDITRLTSHLQSLAAEAESWRAYIANYTSTVDRNELSAAGMIRA